MNKKSFFVALAVAALSAFPVCAQTIDVKGNAEPFTHYWSVGVGAGRANEGLRAGWLEHLEVVKKHCGFQYVRMHGLFDDDNRGLITISHFSCSSCTIHYFF